MIPRFRLNSQYTFNKRNSISISAQYNVDPVRASDKTPDIIQENELLYKVGNVHLKNTHWGKATIDYTWLVSSVFSVSAFTGWIRYFNHPVPVFLPSGPEGMMLRTLENNGDFQDLFVGTSVTASLLNRALVFKATPKICFEELTGLYASHINYFSLSLNATYYLGRVYFSAYFSTDHKKLIQYCLNEQSIKDRATSQIKIV